MRRANLALALALVAGGCRSRLLAPDAGGTGGSGDLGVGGGDLADSSQYTRMHTAIDCGVQAIAGGDFDGDGRRDLALACSSSATTGTILVLLGNGDGTFTQHQLGSGAPAVDVEHVSVGDLDGDGHDDLVVTYSGKSEIAVLLNTCTP